MKMFLCFTSLYDVLIIYKLDLHISKESSHVTIEIENY